MIYKRLNNSFGLKEDFIEQFDIEEKEFIYEIQDVLDDILR